MFCCWSRPGPRLRRPLGGGRAALRAIDRQGRRRPRPCSRCRLVLCLAGLLVLSEAAGRLPALQAALDQVLEDFHGRSLVQAASGETARELVEVLPRGTYVQLEVAVQTVCRKHLRSQNCQIKAGRREQKCLACFKFDDNNDNPGRLLNKSLRCLSEQNPLFQVGRPPLPQRSSSPPHPTPLPLLEEEEEENVRELQNDKSRKGLRRSSSPARCSSRRTWRDRRMTKSRKGL
ncbi:LOW QUALITY PROTEIN: retinoic acid receptor responder protein 2 [Vipera latastei]